MKEIPKGNWDIKGTWHVVNIETGTHKAILECPECGKQAGLIKHSISEDGTVSPSVVCPNDSCSFHEFIKLKDWKK